MESRRIPVDGLAIHALVADGPPAGPAPVVVLVHGQGMSSRYMEGLGQRPGRSALVHAPDQPGFGDSAKSPEPLTLRELEAFVAGRRGPALPWDGLAAGAEDAPAPARAAATAR